MRWSFPMTAAVRPYLFYDAVVSICTTCFRKIDGKIVFEDGGVWMLKHCPTHGNERVLMSDDVDYYRTCREIYLKPPEMPLRRNTPIRWSCPYDCGLCPDHEQHSCVSLIEVTDACNLRCPICYASSGPERQHHRSPFTPAQSQDGDRMSCRSPAASRRFILTSSRFSTRRSNVPFDI